MQRREFMGGVAALAATRWENEDYDIENAEDWEPIEGGSYTTGTFVPATMRTSGEGAVTSWLLEDAEFEDRTTEVFYDTSGVHVTIEGSSEDLYGGAIGEFDPDEAKQLAAALFQAAEEYDRRSEVDDADQ